MHFFLFLPAFLPDIPIFLVELVGIILAAFRIGPQPRRALPALFGLLAMAAARFLRILVNVVAPVMLLQARRMPAQQYSNIVFWIGLALTLVEAVGLILLLVGIFQPERPAVTVHPE